LSILAKIVLGVTSPTLMSSEGGYAWITGGRWLETFHVRQLADGNRPASIGRVRRRVRHAVNSSLRVTAVSREASQCVEAWGTMKNFIAAIVGLALMALATPARAYVVEITTSIGLASVADKDQLRDAVESAIVDVLTNAIAFSPTVVTIKDARVVADRMYIFLLIADADGEKTLAAISAERPAPSDSESAREPSE
jgi:hypothetical protein